MTYKKVVDTLNKFYDGSFTLMYSERHENKGVVYTHCAIILDDGLGGYQGNGNSWDAALSDLQHNMTTKESRLASNRPN